MCGSLQLLIAISRQKLSQGDFARTARAVRMALSAELPDALEAYRRTFVYLDHHGAATCTESDPHCGVCPLLPDCPEGKTRRR